MVKPTAREVVSAYLGYMVSYDALPKELRQAMIAEYAVRLGIPPSEAVELVNKVAEELFDVLDKRHSEGAEFDFDAFFRGPHDEEKKERFGDKFGV